MTIVSREMSLVQKVFVVKGFYKFGENMSLLQKNFEKEFLVQLEKKTLGVFFSLIACFERTGAVPLNMFYFIFQPDNHYQTPERVEKRKHPNEIVSVDRIDDLDSESEGEWIEVTKRIEYEAPDDPLANGQYMPNPFNPSLKRSPRMAQNAYRPNYAETDDDSIKSLRNPRNKRPASSISQVASSSSLSSPKQFRVGSKFRSHEQLKASFAEADFKNMILGNIKTVAQQKNIGYQSKAWSAGPHIKYFYLRWKCAFEKNSMRANTKCHASISVSLSDCGQYMQVQKIIGHNIDHDE